VYCSRNIVRVIKWSRIRWVGHVARTGNRRDAYRVLVGKPEGKRPLARARRRWNVNIMNFTERACEGEDGIALAQDTNSWHGNVHTVRAFMDSSETSSFSEMSLLREVSYSVYDVTKL
jgi:hypothetical protein